MYLLRRRRDSTLGPGGYARKTGIDAMRRFVDRDGRAWDVVLGRASWGTHVVLFDPVGHEADVRQAEFAAADLGRALEEIDRADPDRLQQLLDASQGREEHE